MPIRTCGQTGGRTNECASASVLMATPPASMRTYSNGHESDSSNFGPRLRCACDLTLHRRCAASLQWRQGAEALRRCCATLNNGVYLELVGAYAHCQNLARVRITREDSHRRRDHASRRRRHGGFQALRRNFYNSCVAGASTRKGRRRHMHNARNASGGCFRQRGRAAVQQLSRNVTARKRAAVTLPNQMYPKFSGA